jgi:hypothetical protein
MLSGLTEFTRMCYESGVPKNKITGRKVLVHRDAVGIDCDPALRTRSKPRLVLTSPPYPGVHVLYHRWQYRGRKETPAPYWIANVQDGCGESYYTFGNRKQVGLSNYFATLEAAFRSVRRLVHRDAVIAQLVGFSSPEEQLPQFLTAMMNAGFDEVPLQADRLCRKVPNRKWYAKYRGDFDASSEILLLHKPSAD